MKRRRITLSDEQIVEMVRLYRQGIGCDRLAVRFGCLPGSIHRRLVAAGVKMRPRGAPSMRRPGRHSHGYITWGESYVHRIVAEAWLDRPLLPGETVHHRDGDKTNNHPDNLQVFASHSEHMKAEKWRVWWTPERDAVLIEMRAAGAPAWAIAGALGTTRYAVDNHVRDLRAAGLIRRIPRHLTAARRGWRVA